MLRNNTKNTVKLQALDHPARITRFPSLGAYSKKSMLMSMRELAKWIEGQKAASKDKLPWLKLATFGSDKSLSPSGESYRTNANVKTITGLEGDYDGERITPEVARARLKKARIAALLYTTARHTPEKPRWRVLCPFSGPLPPDAREDLMARLSGVFDGGLDPASFTLSQAYYAGSVDGDEPVKTYLVDGEFIDKVEGLTLIYKHGGRTKPDPIAAEPAEDQSDIHQAVQRAQAMLEHAKAKIMKAEERTPVIFQQAFHLGGYLACNTLDPEQVFDELMEAAESVGHQATHGEDSTKRTIRNGLAEGEKCPMLWFDPMTLLDDEPEGELDPTTLEDIDRMLFGEEDDQVKSHLTFLSPSECEDLPTRNYVIKGLLAEGDIATIVGAPGAGKSLLAPYMGFRVARGELAFGRRTRQGGVFYVAAEDGHGMRARLKALREEHGEADDFKLVEGVSDLLAKGSADLKALTSAVKAQRPALIVIDTLAVAFPGLEENDAKGMGQVVKVARSLTRWGAAVILIHHDTKDGGNGLPRGHSLLNGALDSNLHLKRENGVVTGKLTKNRNGSTEEKLAFTVAVMPFGEDEDGDPKTVAFCREADAADMPRGARLPPSAKAALKVFHDIGNGAPVDENRWRKACVDGREVSATDNDDSRAKAFTRAVETLTRENVLVFHDGEFAMADSPEGRLTDDDV